MTSTTVDSNVDPAGNPTSAALIPPTPALIRYDAACRAVAVARTVDDVQEIAVHAEAVCAYARKARNRQLELDAAEIRIRAERRVGELMQVAGRTIGKAKGGQPHQRTATGLRKNPVGTPPSPSSGGSKGWGPRTPRC